MFPPMTFIYFIIVKSSGILSEILFFRVFWSWFQYLNRIDLSLKNPGRILIQDWRISLTLLNQYQTVSKTSWYPEIVLLMRNIKMKLFVKKKGYIIIYIYGNWIDLGFESQEQSLGRCINLDFSWCIFFGWKVWSPK